MKFLIVPNFALPYDQRMVSGLAEGFREIGHEAIALGSPMPPEPLVQIVKHTGADVVIQVNRFRPKEPALPPNVRHVAWFQDVFPDTIDGAGTGAREGDIIYALGDAKVLGLKVELSCFVGSLVTGVAPRLLESNRKTVERQTVDFSLCGYIPPPFTGKPSIKRDLVWHFNDLVDRVPLVGSSWASRQTRALLMRRIFPGGYVPYNLAVLLVELTAIDYHPLCGDLDIDTLSQTLLDAARPYVKFHNRKPTHKRHWSNHGLPGRLLAPYRVSSLARSGPVENFINNLTREHPRLLDRVALVTAALEVSQSLELYGPGWRRHEPFRLYHKGVVNDIYSLLSIYRRSRINLANNTHGLGLHSRNLECMAVGGFIFTHPSPHDNKPGGMLTSFEPSVHYGLYTQETFYEEAKRWLQDKTARIKAGERAAAVIQEKHLWRHRAQQIVDDLGR